jgi:tRNA U38,U39,U40 pseudouridine synthase TruA
MSLDASQGCEVQDSRHRVPDPQTALRGFTEQENIQRSGNANACCSKPVTAPFLNPSWARWERGHDYQGMQSGEPDEVEPDEIDGRDSCADVLQSKLPVISPDAVGLNCDVDDAEARWASEAPIATTAVFDIMHVSERSGERRLDTQPDQAQSSDLKAFSCEVVPRSFHATWSCKWRRYVYIFPLAPVDTHMRAEASAHNGGVPAVPDAREFPHARIRKDMHGVLEMEERDYYAWGDVASRANVMLGALEGCELDYNAFGRSTPKGKNCRCLLHYASALLASLPAGGTVTDTKRSRIPVLVFQLVGDRFLRRMVRTLVATTVRESIVGSAEHPGEVRNALLTVVRTEDRLVSAPSAPACGLCFAGAGYNGDEPQLLLLLQHG